MSIAIPGFDRTQAANPYAYTDDQLADRALALKHMRDMWPDVNALHTEWVYDMCKNTEKEALADIMKKVDIIPSKHLTCNDPRSHLYKQPDTADDS